MGRNPMSNYSPLPGMRKMIDDELKRKKGNQNVDITKISTEDLLKIEDKTKYPIIYSELVKRLTSSSDEAECQLIWKNLERYNCITRS